MKKTDTGFKIFAATLGALLVTGLALRFTYSAFALIQTGQVYWYDWELWKHYFAYLPGKILCILLAVLIAALILEALCFIFCGNKKQ